jgi:hypothetical protein
MAAVEDEEIEDDEELDDEDCESDEDEADSDDADDATSDDDRYANINPALLARLRQKRLQDREQRFRRSA